MDKAWIVYGWCIRSASKLMILLLIVFAINSALAQEIPRDTSYNVQSVLEGTVKNYPEAKIASTSIPKEVVADLDVVYLEIPNTPFGDRELHADIFRPKKKGVYPALIMVHGGGWRSGDKSLQHAMAIRLAAKGFVTVCVEYQMLLEAEYPAALHNVKAAVRWTRMNADKYGINPDKIAISGCSAGGQLALLTGLTTGVEEKEGNLGYADFPSDIQAIIDIDGVVDFMAPWSLNLGRSYDSPDVQWLGGMFHEKPETWKDASPIFWANQKSPPILFVKSAFPRFTAGQHELCGMMDLWGIYNEVYQFDVQIHPFWLMDPWVEPTVDYMENFLKKVFAD